MGTETEMSKCIVYIPYELDSKGSGARMIRPQKMIQAFKDIGYSVSVIHGYSKERREKIKTIKKQIRSGVMFDFMYVESHTEPILLTDPHHYPTHPFLDFGFFHFIKRHNIPIGLFYCDIYWKFNEYGIDLPKWKRSAALLCYNIEIKQYEKCLTKFFVPDNKVVDYIGSDKLKEIAVELPPGAEPIQVHHKEYNVPFSPNNPINVFYVGGIGSQYHIEELIKAVKDNEKTVLTICCRKKEWENEKSSLIPLLCDRVSIIHKSSDELKELYKTMDICSLLFATDEYRSFAKPFKAYEYLSHEIPVIATEGTAIGDFVTKERIGWCVPFESSSISKVFDEISSDPSILKNKTANCISTKKNNLWTCRSKTVAMCLSR